VKSRLLTFGLILSLSFNFGFLGALGYRFLENRKGGKVEPDRRIFVQCMPDSGRRMMWFEMAPEQKQKIQHRRMMFHPRVQDIRMKLHDERIALVDLLMQEPVDTTLIEQKIERISKLQGDIEKEVVFQLLREKAELTPDQRRRFLEIMVDQINEPPTDPPPGATRVIRHRFMDEGGALTEKVDIIEEKKEK
jgi:Spy/CpxP family protein refolding chaperone